MRTMNFPSSRAPRTGADGAAGEILRSVDITKDFGDGPVLNGISLTIAPSEQLAIMGPSGSGKSTLLHCLSGVFTPTSGCVFFAGRELSALSDSQRSALRLSHFGFAFQDGQLLPELTAVENVALPLQLAGTPRHQAQATAESVLERLGLGNLYQRLPGKMSGGQAQRVAIARAIAGRPDVLFADEPTGALDQATGHETMQLLTTVAKSVGTALVVVTHDAEVAKWCHRLVEIRDGIIHSDRRIQR